MDEKIIRTFQLGVESHRDEQGRLHNLDGFPAVVNTNSGRREFWRHGELHRDGDLPAVEDKAAGLKVYAQNGKIHRVDGPAVIQPGFEAHYLEGQLHRTTGPAATKKLPNGTLDEVYALHGRQFETRAAWESAIALEGIVQRLGVTGVVVREGPLNEVVPATEKTLEQDEAPSTEKLGTEEVSEEPRKRRRKSKAQETPTT